MPPRTATTDPRRAITPSEAALTLVPALIALVIVVMAPSGSADPTMQRIIGTIWLATIFLIPALVLFALPPTNVGRRFALLFYTSAYASYIVHFYYAVFVHFGGFHQTFVGMRTHSIAITNFVLTAWWTVDLWIAWFGPLREPWVRIERFAAMTFLFLVFVVTELFLRPTAIKYLGLALAVVVPLSLLIRLRNHLANVPDFSRHDPLPAPPDKDHQPMTAQQDQKKTFPIWQISTVGVLTLALLGLAEFFAHQQVKSAAPQAVPVVVQEANPNCPPIVKNVHYFRVINTIAVVYVLVLPALCLFAFRKKPETMNYWLAYWTFSYLAYLAHLVAAIGGMMGWNWRLIFECPRLVNHPYNDTALTVLWGIDVILAWMVVLGSRTGSIWSSPKWVRLERGFVHLWLFASLSGVWITKAENWYIRGIGFFLTSLVLLSIAARIVIKTFDSNTLTGQLYIGLFKVINLFIPWHRLPTWLGIVNLGAYRETLRAKNLYNTKDIPVTNPARLADVPKYKPALLDKRDDDGYFDDLKTGSMGGASTTSNPVAPLGSSAQATLDSMYFDKSQPGARFGRNVPLKYAHADEANLLTPNPRIISEHLLARREFKPAKILNLLAAAWIQFETHDWFNHGEPPFEGEKNANPDFPFTDEQIKPHAIPLEEADPWKAMHGGCPMMHIRPTRPDPTRDYDREEKDKSGKLRYPKTYANAESHWWDGSQIYGSNLETTRRLRSDYQKDADGNLLKDDRGQLIPTGELLKDGKLFIGKDELSLDPSTGTALSGFTGNWWVGLSLLHTVFTREHNAICDAIRREYPYWPGDQIFKTARLVNAALIAKIHTIEWTPAILTHPALVVGMAANWWGLLTETVKKTFGRISQNEAFSGIPGSGVEHGVADFCLTEEFVSVYRLHPLMPDTFSVFSAATGQPLNFTDKEGKETNTYILPDGFIGDQSRLHALNNGATMGDLFYSFGITNPGAVTLHNYPKFLRELRRPEAYGVSEIVDLASIDILRDRERGVPRYNQFLRLLHREPIRSFDDFQNPDLPGLGEELRRVYGTTQGQDNVEMLDLMVGMFSEVVPAGFGFSDTAFRIFILMASRRLKSDRFIAGEAFTPEIYTQVGLNWLENTSMIDILLRHYPELKPSLYGKDNAFAPWRKVEINPALDPDDPV